VIGDSENLIHLDWSEEWKTPLVDAIDKLRKM